MIAAPPGIDLRASESRAAINPRRKDMGLRLPLSQVKGPVMDRLHRSDLLQVLTGVKDSLHGS